MKNLIEKGNEMGLKVYFNCEDFGSKCVRKIKEKSGEGFLDKAIWLVVIVVIGWIVFKIMKPNTSELWKESFDKVKSIWGEI